MPSPPLVRDVVDVTVLNALGEPKKGENVFARSCIPFRLRLTTYLEKRFAIEFLK